MGPDPEYEKQRMALMPEAEKLARQDVLDELGTLTGSEAETLWTKHFHLWMDRLCYERIYNREWPR